jgi:hypothetical protein
MSDIIMPPNIHVQLSHLLQDPVSGDGVHGELHSAAERDSYLDYGAKKLFRILSLAADKRLLWTVYRDALRVYMKVPVENFVNSIEGYKASNPKLHKIISIHDGEGNEVQEMDFEDRNMYSTVFSNTNYWYVNGEWILLSPALKGVVSLVTLERKNLFPAFEFQDLALTLAAERGLINVGNTSRAQLFTQTFAQEIQFIGQFKLHEEKKG